LPNGFARTPCKGFFWNCSLPLVTLAFRIHLSVFKDLVQNLSDFSTSICLSILASQWWAALRIHPSTSALLSQGGEANAQKPGPPKGVELFFWSQATQPRTMNSGCQFLLSIVLSQPLIKRTAPKFLTRAIFLESSFQIWNSTFFLTGFYWITGLKKRAARAPAGSYFSDEIERI